MQLALGVTLLMAATLTTPAQGMQNVVYTTRSDANSLVECTQCQQQHISSPTYSSPVVATTPLKSYTTTTTTTTSNTQQKGGIRPPSRIYSLPYVDQRREVNIEPSPSGGTRYATTTYYTDYYNAGADGSGDHQRSSGPRCDHVVANGGGVHGRVVNNQIYSRDSAVAPATYGGGYDDSKYFNNRLNMEDEG